MCRIRTEEVRKNKKDKFEEKEKNQLSFFFTFGITFLIVAGLSFVDTSFNEIGSCFPSSNSVGYFFCL